MDTNIDLSASIFFYTMCTFFEDNGHYMTDNFRETQRIIQQHLDSSLVTSHILGDNNPVLAIERHLSVKSTATLPALNDPTLFVHLGGGKATTSDLEVFSLPSYSVLAIKNEVTEFQIGGTLDCAVIYFNDMAQTQLFSALPGNEAPLIFSDALISALARQLLNQGGIKNKKYLKTLGKTLLLHLLEVVRQNKSSDDLYFGQNNIYCIHKVINYIHDHLAEDLSSEHLAKQVSLSTGHFRCLFQQLTKCPPHKYIQKVRLERAREMLVTTDQPLADIATEIGYSDQAHMTRSFKEAYDVPPAKFRKSSRNN